MTPSIIVTPHIILNYPKRMSQERSLSNFTVSPRKQSDKTSLAFFIAIMFVINMKSIECLYVGGLLPTKIY